MIPIKLDERSLSQLWNLIETDSSVAPAFYLGIFELNPGVSINDTFLRVDGWHKVSI